MARCPVALAEYAVWRGWMDSANSRGMAPKGSEVGHGGPREPPGNVLYHRSPRD